MYILPTLTYLEVGVPAGASGIICFEHFKWEPIPDPRGQRTDSADQQHIDCGPRLDRPGADSTNRFRVTRRRSKLTLTLTLRRQGNKGREGRPSL